MSFAAFCLLFSWLFSDSSHCLIVSNNQLHLKSLNDNQTESINLPENIKNDWITDLNSLNASLTLQVLKPSDKYDKDLCSEPLLVFPDSERKKSSVHLFLIRLEQDFWLPIHGESNCRNLERVSRSFHGWSNESLFVILDPKKILKTDNSNILVRTRPLVLVLNDSRLLSSVSVRGKSAFSVMLQARSTNLLLRIDPSPVANNKNITPPVYITMLVITCLFSLAMIVCVLGLIFRSFQRFFILQTRRKKSRKLARATKKALQRIPVKQLRNIDPSLASTCDQCTICIEVYKPNDSIRVLPCGHFFHKACIDPWLISHRSCPLCKLDVLKSTAMCEGTGLLLNETVSLPPASTSTDSETNISRSSIASHGSMINALISRLFGSRHSHQAHNQSQHQQEESVYIYSGSSVSSHCDSLPQTVYQRNLRLRRGNQQQQQSQQASSWANWFWSWVFCQAKSGRRPSLVSCICFPDEQQQQQQQQQILPPPQVYHRALQSRRLCEFHSQTMPPQVRSWLIEQDHWRVYNEHCRRRNAKQSSTCFSFSASHSRSHQSGRREEPSLWNHDYFHRVIVERDPDQALMLDPPPAYFLSPPTYEQVIVDSVVRPISIDVELGANNNSRACPRYPTGDSVIGPASTQGGTELLAETQPTAAPGGLLDRILTKSQQLRLIRKRLAVSPRSLLLLRQRTRQQQHNNNKSPNNDNKQAFEVNWRGGLAAEGKMSSVRRRVPSYLICCAATGDDEATGNNNKGSLATGEDLACDVCHWIFNHKQGLRDQRGGDRRHFHAGSNGKPPSRRLFAQHQHGHYSSVATKSPRHHLHNAAAATGRRAGRKCSLMLVDSNENSKRGELGVGVVAMANTTPIRSLDLTAQGLILANGNGHMHACQCQLLVEGAVAAHHCQCSTSSSSSLDEQRQHLQNCGILQLHQPPQGFYPEGQLEDEQLRHIDHEDGDQPSNSMVVAAPNFYQVLLEVQYHRTQDSSSSSSTLDEEQTSSS